MFWGLTPALNLLEEFEDRAQDEYNILLLGGADCRHIFKTLSKRLRRNVKLNFYVMEACPETIAKQLLLLNVAFQPPDAIGLTQKTRIFMELYGNSLLRPATARYLTSAALDLVKMITNLDYMKCVMPYVTLDLKYKERDYIENLFKFWCSGDEFNIYECWDIRLRKMLGVRYDTKYGAFDWDLHMRLKSIGGEQICVQEYHNFRSHGVAFSWLESEATKPNRSMVCGVIANGAKFAHYGYLGDMETGPFVTYGLDCEDKEFLKRTNTTNTYRSTDVTERNLMQIFQEMFTGEPYVHQRTSSFTLGHVQTTNCVKVIDVGPSTDSKSSVNRTCIEIENVKVHFLSLSQFSMLKHKQAYKSFFDLVYFNFIYLKYFDGDVLETIARENAVLIVENQLFVVANRKKELEEHEQMVCNKMNDIKYKKPVKFDCQKDFYIRFILKENLPEQI